MNVCYCANIECQKFGCKIWNDIKPNSSVPQEHEWGKSLQKLRNMKFENPKKPHKCPVCDGSGRYKLATAQHASDIIDCRPCKGEGIVWG